MVMRVVYAASAGLPSGSISDQAPSQTTVVKLRAAKACPYGVGDGEAFLYTWPLAVLTCPFVAVGAAAVVVAVVPSC